MPPAFARPPLLPSCSFCTQRLTRGASEGFRTFQFCQVRGKTAAAERQQQGEAITVELLKDVKTFGKRGSIVPISPGEMRNRWFPQKIAKYVTDIKLKELESANVRVERNYEFGLAKKTRAKSATSRLKGGRPSITSSLAELEDQGEKPKATSAKLKLLTPTRSIELLEIFVPSFIEVPCAVNAEDIRKAQEEAAESERRAREASLRKRAPSAFDIFAAAAAQQAAQAKAVEESRLGLPIYGSVTSADVAEYVRKLLSDNEEAARVVITEQDITFVDAPEGKIRRLGDYKATVSVKGAKNSIERTVRLVAVA